MIASSNTVSFGIDTEITPAYFDSFMKFFYQQYILAHKERFPNVKLTVGEDYVLSFTALGPSGRGYVDVEMKAGSHIA